MITADFENMFFSMLAAEQGAEREALARDKDIADSIRAGLFSKQLNVIKDKARRKSAICPRRAGKSWVAMSYAFDVALRNARAKIVLITLTLKSAKNIYWFQMQDFCRMHGIAAEFYANELRIQLPNGSQLMLVGAESHAQIDKLRGGSYDLCIIDEAKSYPASVLTELISDVIDPALMDRKGTLLMIGTPGSILDGPFFQSTYPEAKNKKGKLFSRTFDEPEAYWVSHPKDRSWSWSRHSWTLQDNVHLPEDTWENALLLKEKMGWSDDHPTWQREYLGRWVASESAFVYAFANLVNVEPEKVTWKPGKGDGFNNFGLPEGKGWNYILGLDLGFEDDFAAVIAAYNSTDGCLYQVWEYKDNHRDVDQVAGIISLAAEKVGGEFAAVVADTAGLGKMVIETLNRRHGWNIQPADKRQKNDYIELLNADYQSGRCKLLDHSDLSLEKQALQWDTSRGAKEKLARTGKLKEHPSFPNHLCDAWLYAFKFSYHFWQDERPDAVHVGSKEWVSQQELEAMRALAAAREAEQNLTMWEEIESRSQDPLRGYNVNSGFEPAFVRLEREWRN